MYAKCLVLFCFIITTGDVKYCLHNEFNGRFYYQYYYLYRSLRLIVYLRRTDLGRYYIVKSVYNIGRNVNIFVIYRIKYSTRTWNLWSTKPCWAIT